MNITTIIAVQRFLTSPHLASEYSRRSSFRSQIPLSAGLLDTNLERYPAYGKVPKWYRIFPLLGLLLIYKTFGRSLTSVTMRNGCPL